MCADLLDEMDAIRKELHVENGPEAIGQCASRVEEVLLNYQNRSRQADQDRATEFKNVLGILNEVLSYLTTDNQKAEDRRKQLEVNLSMAARVDDMPTLRSHLSKILQAVRDERRQEKNSAQEVIESLGKQISQVHKAQSRFMAHLPGRASAIEYLKPMIDAVPRPVNLHIALFVADSLRLIRERHGEEVANSILQDLGLKQLEPSFPGGKVFCWSANALVLVWQHAEAGPSPGDILARWRLPHEQRAFVGTRVAVFNIALRSLVVEARSNFEDLLLTLDRFSRGGGA